MSRSIIKKDSDEIAVFSSIIDDFIFEGTLSDYKDLLLKEAYETIESYIANLRKGNGFSKYLIKKRVSKEILYTTKKHTTIIVSGNLARII